MDSSYDTPRRLSEGEAVRLATLIAHARVRMNPESRHFVPRPSQQGLAAVATQAQARLKTDKPRNGYAIDSTAHSLDRSGNVKDVPTILLEMQEFVQMSSMAT